jgi:hypothetical protein
MGRGTDENLTSPAWRLAPEVATEASDLFARAARAMSTALAVVDEGDGWPSPKTRAAVSRMVSDVSRLQRIYLELADRNRAH